MATATAINMRKNAALERIENVLPGFEMPRQGNNPDLIMAQQVEAIADWLERYYQKPVVNGLSRMQELEAANKPMVVNAWDLPTGETSMEDENVDDANLEETTLEDKASPRGKGKHK